MFKSFSKRRLIFNEKISGLNSEETAISFFTLLKISKHRKYKKK